MICHTALFRFAFLLYLGHMYGNASCMGSLALLRNSNGSLQFLFVWFFFNNIIVIIIIIIIEF